MNEKEKSSIMRLSMAMPKLDKEKQSYVLGIAEGMVIMKDSKKEKERAGDLEGRGEDVFIT